MELQTIKENPGSTVRYAKAERAKVKVRNAHLSLAPSLFLRIDSSDLVLSIVPG